MVTHHQIASHKGSKPLFQTAFISNVHLMWSKILETPTVARLIQKLSALYIYLKAHYLVQNPKTLT